MSAGEQGCETLSQRELRNESGRVLRAVSEGQEFVVTNSGVPVGRLVPLNAVADGLPIARPARRTGGWSALNIERRRNGRSASELLDELRTDRM